MCGIVGYAGLVRGPDLQSSTRDAIVHRGPDASGSWSTSDGCILLSHRRLVVLDLSAAGAQPMTNSASTCAAGSDSLSTTQGAIHLFIPDTARVKMQSILASREAGPAPAVA